MKTKHYLLIALVGLLLGLSSCSRSNDGDFNGVYFDFVTFVSSNESGTTFTMRKLNDSPLVTLHTTQTLTDVNIDPGTRLLISYSSESGLHYVSGTIKVYEIFLTEGKGALALGTTAEATDNWASQTIKLGGIERSGEYLNFQVFGYCTSETKVINFVYDQSTINSEMPDYYIIFNNLGNAIDGEHSFFCSWSIEDVWSLNSCKGVRVHYKDATTGEQIVEIKKDSNDGK